MSNFQGIALKVTSVLLFTVMDALIKASAEHVPPGEAVFFRSLLAIPVIVIWLMATGNLRSGLRTTRPILHVWRGLVGTTAMALGFAALGYLPLPEVVAMSYASPLLTVVFAAMFLGERVRFFRIGAVGIGLVGVVIILVPRLTVLESGTAEAAAAFGAMLVLGSAVFRALAQIHIRKMVSTESTSAIVFYFSLTATCLSLFTLPFGWVLPTGVELIYLVLAGLIGGLAQIFLTSAYRVAPVSVVAPFEYASMIFAVIIGYVVFAELPTSHTIVGATLIIGAGFLIIWRERRLGLQRGRARPSLTPRG